MDSINSSELQAILTYAGGLSWSGVCALIVWKIAVPMSKLWIESVKMKRGAYSQDFGERLDTFENNHMEHFRSDLSNFDRRLNEMSTRFDRLDGTVNNIREDVGLIKGRLNGNVLNKH